MNAINAQPIQILLVDDSEDDVLLMREALQESKLINCVDVLRNGEEALAYLRRQGRYADARRPGLILLDINMPKKNGFEVLEELKKDDDLKHIPIVMLTGSRNEIDILRSYNKGACSYVTKPVTLEKLKEVVRQFEIYWALVSRVPAPDASQAA